MVTAPSFKYQKTADGGFTKTPLSPDQAPIVKPSSKSLQTAEGLKTYALQNNVDLPQEQPPESTLQRILNLLNTGAYAVGGLISGKGIVRGIKEHTLPSEALGIKNKVGGFIADVLLDPTTYITFGYGGGAKLATEAGEVVLNKVGTSLLKKSIVDIGEEAARKALAKKVLEEGGEKFLAKGGLKFAGTEILPRKAVTAPLSMVDSLIEKTPVVGKAYQAVKDVGAKAFTPFKEIKELPSGVGQRYLDKFINFTKGTRAEVQKAVEEAGALGKQAKAELGSKAGTAISQLLETAGQAAPDVPFRPSMKNPVKVAKDLGFDTFAEDLGGKATAKQHASEFWSKNGKSGVFYHLTTGEPFTEFDKAKAASRFAERGGGISEIKGLYLGRDEQATKAFYGLDEQKANLIKFEGQPKLLNLTKKADEEKFLTEVQKKYGIKNTKSPEFGSALEKELNERGFDGAKYFDPYATGEEVVITNPQSVKATGINGKAIPEAIPAVAASKKAETGNKVIDDIMGYIQGQHREFATKELERGILPATLPDYLRHYLTPAGRDFIEKRGGEITAEISKPIRVKAPFAKVRELKGTIQQINKYFERAYGVKLFEEDAFKAFAARKVENIKAVNTYDFLNQVGQEFGKPAEYVAKQTKNPLTGQLVAKQEVKPFYENGMKYVESSIPQLKGMLLPEPILKHVDDTYKVLTNEEATKKFLKFYDKVIGFWKGSVTGWFPAFHTRNFLGGTFNNFIAGVKNPSRYLQADQIARGAEGAITTKLGTRIGYNEVMDMAKKLGVVGQPGYLDVMRTVENDISKGPVKKLMEAPQAAMEYVENRLRLPLFIDRIIKGDAPEAAAKDVFKFHFDYAPEALATFEQNVMKRLIPFYRWARGNIPLQLEQITKQPGKYAALGKLVQNLQTDKQKAKKEFPLLPPYMREDLPIRLGEQGGFSQYLYGLGLPVEDLNRLYKGSGQRTVAGYVNELSPLFKYPIEVATGQNMFYGEPIEKNTRVYPFVNSIPGLKQWLGVKEKKMKDGSVTYTADPYKLHFINSALGRFYTTAGKITDDKTSGAVKFLYGLIGAKSKAVDMEKQQFYQQQDVQDRIEQALENQGLIKKFDRNYIPK